MQKYSALHMMTYVLATTQLWVQFCQIMSLLVVHFQVCWLIIIIMYIYHALINALSAQMKHINLNMIFYTHVEHSPTKTVYIKYDKK